MPVSGDELVTLLIALVATALVVFGIRRVSQRSQLGDAGKRTERKLQGRTEATSQDDNDSDAFVDDDEDQEEEETKAKKNTQSETDSATGLENDNSEEQRRLDAGLAKTRSSGFVSRLGKLFSRKKIDDSFTQRAGGSAVYGRYRPKDGRSPTASDQDSAQQE